VGRYGLIQLIDGDLLKSQSAFKFSQSCFHIVILHDSPRWSCLARPGLAAADFTRDYPRAQ
jgi:hypothetical protein